MIYETKYISIEISYDLYEKLQLIEAISHKKIEEILFESFFNPKVGSPMENEDNCN